MSLVRLPNGMRVHALRRAEALFLYHEIFRDESYLQYGIDLLDGQCVFDVGANIGLFSLFLVSRYRNLKLYLFEPIPSLCVLAERNLQPHWAGSCINLCRCGLAGRPGDAVFEFDRFGSLGTTMHSADVLGAVRKDAAVSVWLAAIVLDLERMSSISPRLAHLLVSSPVLRPIAAGLLKAWFAAVGVRRRLTMQRVECPLKTVSQVIREHDLESIDLMKIDAEGSELDILMGIEAQDWPKVRQLVVEVHDVDGRVDVIRSMLAARGYQVATVADVWQISGLLGISKVYAVRT